MGEGKCAVRVPVATHTRRLNDPSQSGMEPLTTFPCSSNSLRLCWSWVRPRGTVPLKLFWPRNKPLFHGAQERGGGGGGEQKEGGNTVQNMRDGATKQQ